MTYSDKEKIICYYRKWLKVKRKQCGIPVEENLYTFIIFLEENGCLNSKKLQDMML